MTPLDLSDLPQSGMRSASPTWWGNLAFMLIEGTGFALAIAMYLTLAAQAPTWPAGAPLPGSWPGLSLTAVLLASLLPNHLLSRATDAKDLRRVRWLLILMLAIGAGLLVLRAYEFAAFHVRWDEGAYGSLVWLLLGLHTTHLIADWGETAVLTALMFTGHAANPRRFGDVQDEVGYWNFIILTWLPVFACLYGVPRL